MGSRYRTAARVRGTATRNRGATGTQLSVWRREVQAARVPPQWSSRSGDGSAAGILFIIGGTPEGVAQRSHGLRHKIGTGKTRGRATSVPLRLRQLIQCTIVPYL